jgi:hypothetical protein
MDQVLVEHQPLTEGEYHLVIKTQYWLSAPPLVIYTPPVFYGFYSLPSRRFDRERQGASSISINSGAFTKR